MGRLLAGCDTNCIIFPGEHSFVFHETVIAYEKGRLIGPPEQAQVLKNLSLCPRKDPVSTKLLERIQLGALASDLTAEKLKNAVRASMAQQKAAQGVEPSE